MINVLLNIFIVLNYRSKVISSPSFNSIYSTKSGVKSGIINPQMDTVDSQAHECKSTISFKNEVFDDTHKTVESSAKLHQGLNVFDCLQVENFLSFHVLVL